MLYSQETRRNIMMGQVIPLSSQNSPNIIQNSKLQNVRIRRVVWDIRLTDKLPVPEGRYLYISTQPTHEKLNESDFPKSNLFAIECAGLLWFGTKLVFMDQINNGSYVLVFNCLN